MGEEIFSKGIAMTRKCDPLASSLLIILVFAIVIYLNAAEAGASGADGLRLETARATPAARMAGPGADENASAVKPKFVRDLEDVVSNVGAGEVLSASLNLLEDLAP